MTDSKSNGASAGVLAEAYQFSSNNSDQNNDKSADGSNFLNDQSADGSSFGNDDNGNNRDNDDNGNNRDNDDNGNNRDNEANGNGNNRDNEVENEDNGNNRDNEANGNGNNRDNEVENEDNGNNRDNEANGNGNNRDNEANDNEANDNGNNRDNEANDNGNNRGNEYSSDGDDGNTTNLNLQDSLKSYKDSFNSDDDAIDVDALCASLEDVIGTVGEDALSVDGGQALLGNGNVFSIQQAANLYDQDAVHQPSVSLQVHPGGSYSLNANGVYGGDGISAQQNGITTASGSAQLSAGANATADAFAGHESLTMTLSMGANTQFTSVDMSVVGGNADSADFGDA